MIGSIGSLSAQNDVNKTMSLQDLFEIAESNNRNLKISDFNINMADEAVNDEKKKLLPSLEATLTSSYNSNATISDRDFMSGFTVPVPHFGNNFMFDAKQLIYAGSAVNKSIAMAKNNSTLANLDKEKDRQNIRFMISGFYLELLKLNNQKVILEKNRTQTEKLLAQIKAKLAQGAALKNNVTRYELQLQGLDIALLKVGNGLKMINNELVKVLQLPADTKIIAKNEVSSTILGLPHQEVWAELVLAQSPELKQVDLAIDQAEKTEKLVKSDKLPQVFAFATARVEGPITIEIPNINKNISYWYAGVGMKYNVASLYKNKTKANLAKMATQKTRETNALVKDELLTAVKNAHLKYEETRKIYQTHLKGVELANQNYTVIRNRYLNDLVLITEMLDAENSKVDAEMQAANAQINILFQYYQMKKITGTL